MNKKELRGMFFKEHTYKCENGIPRVITHPHNLFEWFYEQLSENSYAIVRWHENKHEDVVCVDKQTALGYVQKYNKLAGKEMCFLDEEIWLPLKDV